MPEYLAPGVYVEEKSFRSKSIEGVSTSTAGFIGPCRFGPCNLEPDIITSLGEFEKVYGDGNPLTFTDGTTLANYVWHAVRAFFEEGGKRAYVQRVFSADSGDGCSSATLGCLELKSRFPGKLGDSRGRLIIKKGGNVLGTAGGNPAVRALKNYDVVLITSSASVPAREPGLYIAEFSEQAGWTFTNAESTPEVLRLDNLSLIGGDHIYVVTVSVSFMPSSTGEEIIWSDIPLDPRHRLSGTPDWLLAQFPEKPLSPAIARGTPLVITASRDITDGLDLFTILTGGNSGLLFALESDSVDAERTITLYLKNGDDGMRPGYDAYVGADDPDALFKTGLKAFEDIEDISMIAAPGHTDDGALSVYKSDREAITNLLISHAERMQYRIAILDSVKGQTISDVRSMKAKLDSKYAALYYPWIRTLDPITKTEILLPPSGFVAGIYARNDTERGVFKAPANETVRLALGFEVTLNKAQQDVLNPEGVNCFRFFEGRGNRLWGARTISSDPEWKYVNLRRYFAFLERSIDKGTQWAVFEPNGEALWANVRRTISDFLLNEWMSGALLGDKPEKAYFVKCDRSTMSQNDLDNGRLVCLIGVAPLRPAEFVIFRIGQWTADSKV